MIDFFSEKDFSKMCRTCFGKLKLAPIHRLHVDCIPVTNLLSSYLTLQVSTEDCLPQKICIKCVKVLHEIHEFSKKTHQNQSILETILMKSQGPEKTSNINQGIVEIGLTLNPENVKEVSLRKESTAIVETHDKENQDLPQEIDTDTANLNYEVPEVGKRYLEIPSSDFEIDAVEVHHDYLNRNNGETDLYSTTDFESTQEHLDQHKDMLNSDRVCISPTLATIEHITDIEYTPEHLGQHNKTEPSETETYRICSVCGMEVKDSEYLSHLRIHKQVKVPQLESKFKEVQGTICGSQFRSFDLSDHASAHDKVPPHKGEICSMESGLNQNGGETDLYSTIGHAIDLDCEQQNGEGEILNSDRTSNSPIEIDSTSDHSENETTYRVCPSCGIEVPDTEYWSHLRTHNSLPQKRPKPQAKHQCSDCGKLVNPSYMLDHMRTHNKLSPHKCKICSKEFCWAVSLSRHMKTHAAVRPHLCHICGKGFIPRDELNKHINKHLKNLTIRGVTDFTCDVCSADFKKKSLLQIHIRNVHSNRNPRNPRGSRLMCNLCGKIFGRAAYYIHLRSHSGEKPFVCSICNRAFSTGSYLKIHQMKHTGERPHKCSSCSATFRHSTCLLRHVRVIHQNERNFKCALCGKSFSQKSSLELHLNTHSGATPFGCEICGRHFANPSTLRRHRQRKCLRNKN